MELNASSVTEFGGKSVWRRVIHHQLFDLVSEDSKSTASLCEMCHVQTFLRQHGRLELILAQFLSCLLIVGTFVFLF